MTTAQRPPLERGLNADDFLAFYWLKNELMVFCRAHGLPATGSKIEITQRIAHFLRSGEVLPSAVRPSARPDSAAPNLDTIITAQYRSTQANRAFFKQVIGPRFHFSTAFQQFFKDNVGKTYADAVAYWQELEAQRKRGDKTEIAPQFEYNRFIREYHMQHPGAPRSEAIAAWKEHRSQRR